jgi:hypothetical protein
MHVDHVTGEQLLAGIVSQPSRGISVGMFWCELRGWFWPLRGPALRKASGLLDLRWVQL